MKRNIIRLLALILLCMMCLPAASADEPLYRSYAYTPDGYSFFMQTPYEPAGIVGQYLYAADGSQLKGLNAPSDMSLAEDGTLYIADRGNKRIVQMNLDGVLLREIGVGTLKTPEGVYVDADGTLYVADSGHACLFVFNADGSLRLKLTAPDDVRLTGIMFTPMKVMADDRGYIYALLKGSNEGLMVMSPNGKFQGYFGRNATQMTLGERIKRIIYTDEQVETNANAVAPSITGMCVSRNGFIYTTTANLKSLQIKKFNANGDNLFAKVQTQVEVDRRTDAKSAVSALYVNEDGLIFAVDATNGAVILYDASGAPMLMFGEKLVGNDRKVGFFSDPCAITAMEDGHLLVLDRAYNGVHVFRPTSLTKKIIHAVSLYNDGRYYEAEGEWQDILKANSSYYWANLGLGRIAYMRGDYQESMNRMVMAENQEYYSDAMWKLRAATVQAHAATVILVLAGAWMVHTLLKKLLRFNVFTFVHGIFSRLHDWLVKPVYRRFPGIETLVQQLKFAPNVLLHPVDTYYDATRRRKGSLLSAAIVYIAFLALMLASRAVTSFTFDMEGIRGVNLVSFLLLYVAPIVLWILGNYLVGAITKGQGTMRGIIISTMYALMPLIVLSLPLAILSNALTLAEASIYSLAQTLIALWTVLLLFTQVKEIHGYGFGETVKNILWILFVAAMAVVGVLAIVGILIQGWNFLNEFIRELLGYV